MIPDKIMVSARTLKEVNVPDTVETIGNSAFSGCQILENFYCPSSITSIDNYAFNGCTLLSNINIPDNLEHLGSYAFANCISLEEITIPATLTNSESYPFSKSGIKKVTFENGATYVNENLFYDAHLLETVIMPDTVTEIGSQAFRHCFKLKSVKLPENLEKIGSYAFYDTRLESISLPQSVGSIYASSIGYYNGMKVDNFTIYGYADTEAQTYANRDGFTFVDMSVSYDVGDVNRDGSVDVNDATYLQIYLAGNNRPDGGIVFDTTSPMIYKITNTNCDNYVDVNDVSYIQMMIARIV